MRLTTITMAAAVGLALVTGTAACDREQTGAADQTQASPTHTGHTPDMGETPGHHDPYKEAAEKFALPQQRITKPPSRPRSPCWSGAVRSGTSSPAPTPTPSRSTRAGTSIRPC